MCKTSRERSSAVRGSDIDTNKLPLLLPFFCTFLVYASQADPCTLSRTVSQFTLLATLKKGNKPDFHKAADPTTARELYEYFYSRVQSLYAADRVKDGVFQAMMEVGLVNDGPVCVLLPLSPSFCTYMAISLVLRGGPGHSRDRHQSRKERGECQCQYQCQLDVS